MVMTSKWVPYCFEDMCLQKHEKKIPTHGSCCMCQECGQHYDDCICKFEEEPCLSCKFKEEYNI